MSNPWTPGQRGSETRPVVLGYAPQFGTQQGFSVHPTRYPSSFSPSDSFAPDSTFERSAQPLAAISSNYHTHTTLPIGVSLEDRRAAGPLARHGMHSHFLQYPPFDGDTAFTALQHTGGSIAHRGPHSHYTVYAPNDPQSLQMQHPSDPARPCFDGLPQGSSFQPGSTLSAPSSPPLGFHHRFEPLAFHAQDPWHSADPSSSSFSYAEPNNHSCYDPRN
ncbi:hypothetical protein JCM16303_003515 [Sporobolomyces ruberrimus]